MLDKIEVFIHRLFVDPFTFMSDALYAMLDKIEVFIHRLFVDPFTFMSDALYATIALVAAILAVCVTVYIFLFGELNNWGNPTGAIQDFVTKLQLRYKRTMSIHCILSLFSIGACYALILLEFPLILTISLLSVVISIIICLCMVYCCFKMVRYRDELEKAALNKLKEVLEKFNEECSKIDIGLELENHKKKYEEQGMVQSNYEKLWRTSQRLSLMYNQLHYIAIHDLDNGKSGSSEICDFMDGTNSNEELSSVTVRAIELQNYFEMFWAIWEAGQWFKEERIPDSILHVGNTLHRPLSESLKSILSPDKSSGASIPIRKKYKKSKEKKQEKIWKECTYDALILGNNIWKWLCMDPSSNFSSAPHKILSNQRFTDIDYSEADFKDAYLSGTIFRNCDLSNARFSDSTLRNAEVCSCYLPRADFRGADCTSFVLRACTASNIVLVTHEIDADNSFNTSSCDLNTLEGKIAISNKSLFESATFDESLLSRASIVHNDAGPKFSLKFCSFKKVSLVDSRIKNVDIGKSVWTGATLSKSSFVDCCLKACDFSSSSFSGAKLVGCDFKNACLTSTYFGNSIITASCFEYVGGNATEFEHAELRFSAFSGAALLSASFSSAKLFCCCIENSTFDESNLVSTDFDHVFLNGSIGRYIRITKCNFTCVTLCFSCLSNLVWIGGKVSQSIFRGLDLTDGYIFGLCIFKSLLTNLFVRGARFVNTHISASTRFVACDCSRSTFFRCSFTDVSITDIDLTSASFDYSRFSDTTFSNITFRDSPSFSGATLNNVDFSFRDSDLDLIKDLRQALNWAASLNNVTINGIRIEKR